MAKLKKLTEQEMLQYKRRFMKLNEYSFVNKEDDLLLDEADDDVPAPDGDVPALDGGAPAPDGGVPAPDGGVPAPDGGVPAPDGGVPAPDAPMEMPMEAEPETNEVEIDITDLTQKQDDVDAKVSTISSETSNMMDMLSKLTDKIEGIIKNTDSEMAKIKDEIVKRNPTPVEVLQKRITVSDPFNQTPADYWKKKEAEGHYKLSDNDEEVYELKGSDINGSASEIYKSFGITDDEMNQSLATMFRM